MCYDSKSVTTGTRQNQRDLESEFSRIRIDQGTRPAAAAGASEVRGFVRLVVSSELRAAALINDILTELSGCARATAKHLPPNP